LNIADHNSSTLLSLCHNPYLNLLTPHKNMVQQQSKNMEQSIPQIYRKTPQKYGAKNKKIKKEI